MYIKRLIVNYVKNVADGAMRMFALVLIQNVENLVPCKRAGKAREGLRNKSKAM